MQANNKVNDAIAGPIPLLRFAEPVSKDSVLRDAVQHTIRSNNRGINCAGENEESNHDYKSAEQQLQQERTAEPHDQFRKKVVLVTRQRNALRNNHYGQQRPNSGEHEAVNGDDDRSALQVLELRMRNFAVDLRQRLFAAHRQYGMSECHEDAEQTKVRGQTCAREEAERCLAEVKIRRSW